MQIVSQIICKSKIIYKAIILDLDDTLWQGTLSEEGIESIRQGLHSTDASAYVAFMRFMQVLAKELGIYVAICSRNDSDEVRLAIDKLKKDEFPIKDQIDCIVANYNDKSKNIQAIAEQLSILTSACVFVDDNPLNRDEVRKELPEVFVPEWENHDELITLLMSCCIFNRFELSLASRDRKRTYKILQLEREKSNLPKLHVDVTDDISHKEANSLYSKSNQFRFAEKAEPRNNCKSLFFKIYRDNGEDLGICSAFTYTETDCEMHVLNWAISCKYFEIGLEEYILQYIIALSNGKKIIFTFKDMGINEKALALIEKYKSGFLQIDNGQNFRFIPSAQLINDIQLNTNLKAYLNE